MKIIYLRKTKLIFKCNDNEYRQLREFVLNYFGSTAMNMGDSPDKLS